jgi:hypothetical protein
MAARRRSFHLNVNASSAIAHPIRSAALNPQGIEAQAGALTIGLLAFARQASAFAFTLVGGCAPGIRQKTKRVPRALLAGSPRAAEDAKLPLEGGITGIEATGTATRELAEVFECLMCEEQLQVQVQNDSDPRADKTTEPQIELQEEIDLADTGRAAEFEFEKGELPVRLHHSSIVLEDPERTPQCAEPEKPALELQGKPTLPITAPPIAIGLGLFIPSASSNELKLLSPLASRYASPEREIESVHTHRLYACVSSGSPQNELRANIVSKVAAFTAARLSGSRRPSASPTPRPALPPRPAYLDDPFAESFAATPPSSFVPTHPARLCYPSLQFSSNQQQSPTPSPRPGRSSLRQRTVYFTQVSPRAGTPPPAFWSPHPAGSQSCAILIKVPPSVSPQRHALVDKENQPTAKTPALPLDTVTRGRHRRGLSHVFDTI